MKTLEKDRKRRYETASGLAMDIERCLNHEPIIARPPSRLYRLQKSREMIAADLQPGLDAGNGSQGFWFDWVLARILMREAVTVLGETPSATAARAGLRIDGRARRESV